MATKKTEPTPPTRRVEHTITHVEAQSTNQQELQHITKGNATPYRILAIVLWVLALDPSVPRKVHDPLPQDPERLAGCDLPRA